MQDRGDGVPGEERTAMEIDAGTKQQVARHLWEALTGGFAYSIPLLDSESLFLRLLFICTSHLLGPLSSPLIPFPSLPYLA
jgi:hypothetical protein